VFIGRDSSPGPSAAPSGCVRRTTNQAAGEAARIVLLDPTKAEISADRPIFGRFGQNGRARGHLEIVLIKSPLS
jgi:hypothetical protein